MKCSEKGFAGNNVAENAATATIFFRFQNALHPDLSLPVFYLDNHFLNLLYAKIARVIAPTISDVFVADWSRDRYALRHRLACLR